MTISLNLEECTISGNSVSAAVCVLPPDARVTEELATAVLALRPTLAEHACKQQGMGYFGDRIVGATLPHLVEHLAIDLLVEEQRHRDGDNAGQTRSPRHAIAGTTTWLDREQGRMRVRISSTAQNKEGVCTAITRAVALLNSLLDQ